MDFRTYLEGIIQERFEEMYKPSAKDLEKREQRAEGRKAKEFAIEVEKMFKDLKKKFPKIKMSNNKDHISYEPTENDPEEVKKLEAYVRQQKYDTDGDDVVEHIYPKGFA